MPERPGQAAFRFLLSRDFWLAVLLLVVLAVVAAIRIRLLNVPLERDEGEYAYAGQLMLQGVPPYQDVYSMKWPGTFAAYALIMEIFGQTIGGIHAGLVLVNLATAALIFVLAKRVCGKLAGVVAAGTYALLSITPPTLGLAAHAAHFVALFALGGILLIQNLNERTSAARVFAAGLLLGISVLMKQSGAIFGLFTALWIVRQEAAQAEKEARRLAIRLGSLALGGALPVLLMGAVLAVTGVFGQFWLWTVEYARAYSAIFTPAEGTQVLLSMTAKLFQAAPGLWSAAGFGVVLLFCERSLRPERFFIRGFAAFSFLAVCPGWYFREHYFLLLLPAVGLLAGVAVEVISRWMVRLRLPLGSMAVPILLFAGAAAWTLIVSRAIFFQLAPAEVSREIYGANPFPEAVEIGRYLKAHSPPDARIAVVGSEPELYFYSHRRSATGYIYTYPLMEPQPLAVSMQREMISEIEKANPAYTVFVCVPASWLERSDSPTLILDWFEGYQRERLTLAAWVEMLSGNPSEYHWSVPAGQPFAPESKRWVAIFKNKPPPAAPPESR